MKNRSTIALAAILLFAAGALFGASVTKVYIEHGGAKLVVASGGEIELQSGSTLDVQSGTTFAATSATFTTPALTSPVITSGARLVGAAAPPVACAAGTAGTSYYDSDINKVCICNATNYVLANDDSTTTGCS